MAAFQHFLYVQGVRVGRAPRVCGTGQGKPLQTSDFLSKMWNDARHGGALKRLEDGESEANLGYLVKPHLKKIKAEM